MHRFLETHLRIVQPKLKVKLNIIYLPSWCFKPVWV